MEERLLSIIIPTKNREKYCIEAIKQILSVTTEKTELVIQDNGDGEDINNFILSLNSNRIVYNKETKIISFVDNFSAAVSLAGGKYLCMLGDDDGVLPNIESLTEYMQSEGADALIPGLNSVYFWPNEEPNIKNEGKGTLWLTYIKNRICKADNAEGLKKLLKNGAQDYQKLDIPRLYHGIVSRDILTDIKNTVGTYFKGLTPDMYMAVALAIKCKNVLRIKYPVTISGICHKSGSAASATGAHTGELKDAPHFIGHESYEWDKRVPYIYTVETIWAETALQALRDFGEDKNSFSILALNSQLYKKYPQFRKRILEHSSEFGFSKLQIISTAYTAFAIKFIKRCVKRLFRKKGDVIKTIGVYDIKQAESKTLSTLTERGINI